MKMTKPTTIKYPAAPAFIRAPAACALLASTFFVRSAMSCQADVAVHLTEDSAGLRTLMLDSCEHTFTGAGGFAIYDATKRRQIVLRQSSLKARERGVVYEATGEEVALTAEFIPQGDYLLVKGEVTNKACDERGFIVDYKIPRPEGNCRFSNSLGEAVALPETGEIEDNVFPLAALCGDGSGVAAAIPPGEPRDFGTVGDRDGLRMRFYLGTSPMPRRFPNRASFVFMIYSVDPAWGFRSALAKYYKFHPDYYTQLMKKEGLCMFQMKDRVPENIGHYGFNLCEPQWPGPALESAIVRDDRNDITTFPYMIVGQREIKFLPKLPGDYEEIMAVYEKWSPADHARHGLTKENVASQGDIYLKEEVVSSACETSAGRRVIVLRNTLWGKNSITFKINPNPDLFADAPGTRTTGGLALELAGRWLNEHPEYDGMFIDSLGANWPAVLNYRKDHFIYARYPLTFDPDGKVALQNTLSHYEYMETLRERMRGSGRHRLLFGNGVYAYKSRMSAGGAMVERQQVDTTFNEFHATAAPPEHYRAGTRLGRFFCSALLDVASSEFGVKATVEQCRDVRVFMGKKPYAFLNYHWEDGALVDEFVNKCLCYGIYASTSTNFFTGVEYETHANGYLRDKRLLDWFVPLARLLSHAGWEPVRHARTRGAAVSCERYGSGDTIYYTLYNDSKERQPCELLVDLAALGFSRQEITVSEIARQTQLAPKDGVISLLLQPKKTYIIKIDKSYRQS
jgi:hypothetical protein